METSILAYFLKVNLALAILYICYRLLFRDDTFFRLRRGVLLSVYLIAFLYPLLDISIWLSSRESMTEIVNYYSTILPQKTAAITNDTSLLAKSNRQMMIESALLLVYLTGVCLLFFRCIVELVMVVRRRFRSPEREISGTTIHILPAGEEPYSFFGWIFVSPDSHTPQALEEILVHENTHVRQFHSADVVLAELVCILYWINPFAWLLKKEISSNHEYLADEQVMLAGYNKKEYQYHLIGLEHPDMAIAKLYNNFSVLPLKKRITMLNKKKNRQGWESKVPDTATAGSRLIAAQQHRRNGTDHEPAGDCSRPRTTDRGCICTGNNSRRSSSTAATAGRQSI